ncbi:MAG: transcriptional regulator [Nitrospirales bacterium]|nr:transcriptional regulator [Nitrospirales bacterium]
MRKRPKEPAAPAERHETVRQEIIFLLAGQTLSARDISVEVRISEREVYEHLDHIQRTVVLRELHLVTTPAECKKCGFLFRKRERLKKPGKCPVCRGEAIKDPLFTISVPKNYSS